MCVAIVKPSGASVPNREILKICFKNNPDGAGFAYCRGGRNYLHKGFFTFKSFWDAFSYANIKKNECALIHFRVATHGNIDKQTCHPFLITDNYKDMQYLDLVTNNGDIMIHNGVLNFELDNDDISDSMYLAKMLSDYDLNNATNRYMFELALQNNKKDKFNRVGILRINNTVETYGFKEPWEEVEGCFFSNKSYMINFQRGFAYSNTYYNNATVTEAEKKEKLEYNEDEIQSKKVKFCHNHDKGCDELGIYAIHFNDKEYDVYCDKCVDNIDYFNCSCCQHSFYKDNLSAIKNVCNFCYENNSEFLVNSKCDICNHEAKHILHDLKNDKNTNKTLKLCHTCFYHEKPFMCAKCSKWFSETNMSPIGNVCLDCYTELGINEHECTYCHSKNNLIRTTYTTICEKCFKQKDGKTCFLCGKPYMYGNNHILNFDFCPTCVKNFNEKEELLNNFKSYQWLDKINKKKIVDLFEKADDETKISVLELYKYNNYFDKIKENADGAYKILNKKGNN